MTDLTGTLSATQIADLERSLTTFEARKGSQIAVLMVPTTKPEDIAHVAVFLAGPAAAYLTGQVLTVDGGMVM